MKLFLTTLFGLFALTVHAQTADEIIQKHAATMGGLDAMNKISSFKYSGTLTLQGMDLPMTTQAIYGKAVRIEVDVMGQQVIQVYNNGTGWTINPFNGSSEATDLTGQSLLDVKGQASLASNLIDYKNRGHQLELAGQENVNGITCFKLKLTNKDDNSIAFYFINSTDHTLIKTTMQREIQGQQMDAETIYSDLKDIGGVKFYMTRVQSFNGEPYSELHIDKVELNVPVDEAIFKKQ